MCVARMDECKLFEITDRTVRECWSRKDPYANPLSAISPGGRFVVFPDYNGRLSPL